MCIMDVAPSWAFRSLGADLGLLLLLLLPLQVLPVPQLLLRIGECGELLQPACPSHLAEHLSLLLLPR